MNARQLVGAAIACAVVAWPMESARATSAARRTYVVTAVERARRAVVNISAQEVVRATAAEDPFELFFGRYQPKSQVRTSLGSGFVFDRDGYLLTNYHVVARGSRIRVSFEDGSAYSARVVGTDPGGDLAVLKIDADRSFSAAPLGKSDDLLLGEPAIAIGNPFGLHHSVSAGVVSALHRPVRAEGRSFYDLVQTDASINPGNSGGPLLNADGEVIGVCSAIYASAQGIGFAIPIDRALRVAKELKKSGELADAYWGFATAPAEARSDPSAAQPGAKITTIEPGSPAAKAGLAPGDVVVKLDGIPVGDGDELRFLMADIPLGSAVRLGLLRNGAPAELSITAARLTPERAQNLFEDRTGLSLEELSPKRALQEGYETETPLVAIKAVRSRSMGSQIGLRRGDLIRAVNSAEIASLKAFRKALGQARKSGRAVLLIQRGYALQEFPIELG